MVAVTYNKLVIFTQKLLKDYYKLGSNLRVSNKFGHSLMHIASIRGNVNILIYLKYEIELKIDEKDDVGMTPAHYSLKEGKDSLVLLYISWGLNLELADHNGNTLLHYTAMYQNPKIARVLIIRGASRTSKNDNNKTPFDLAKDSNFSPMIKILVIFT